MKKKKHFNMPFTLLKSNYDHGKGKKNVISTSMNFHKTNSSNGGALQN